MGIRMGSTGETQRESTIIKQLTRVETKLKVTEAVEVKFASSQKGAYSNTSSKN
jgi:hypothetical protein